MEKSNKFLVLIAVIYLVLLIPILFYLCNNFFLETQEICDILECGKIIYLNMCYNDPLFTVIAYIVLAIPSWIIFLIVFLFKRKNKKVSKE